MSLRLNRHYNLQCICYFLQSKQHENSFCSLTNEKQISAIMIFITICNLYLFNVCRGNKHFITLCNSSLTSHCITYKNTITICITALLMTGPYGLINHRNHSLTKISMFVIYKSSAFTTNTKETNSNTAGRVSWMQRTKNVYWNWSEYHTTWQTKTIQMQTTFSKLHAPYWLKIYTKQNAMPITTY